MTVLAHPDDAEIWCGGTLILHSEMGDEIQICIMSYNEDSIRGEEASKGAGIMGCDVKMLGLEDTNIRQEFRR